MLMEWLKKAPTSIVIVVFIMLGTATLAYLGGYVYLTAIGADTTDYRSILNSAFNYAGVLFGGVATVASVAAARSSSQTAEQTNGHLTAKDDQLADKNATIAQLTAALNAERARNGTGKMQL